MANTDPAATFRRYINLCNEHQMHDISEFFHDELIMNGKPLLRTEFQRMIGTGPAAAPDYRYDIHMLLVDGDILAARNIITLTLQRAWLGLKPTGKTIKVGQHVFYRFEQGKVREGWFLLDIPGAMEQLKS